MSALSHLGTQFQVRQFAMDFFVGGSSSDSDSAAWSASSDNSLNMLVVSSDDGIVALRANDLDSDYGGWSVASSDNSEEPVVFWMELVDEEEEVVGVLDDVPLDQLVQFQEVFDHRGVFDRREFYDFWYDRGFFQDAPNAVPYYDYSDDDLVIPDHNDEDLAYEGDAESTSDADNDYFSD